MFVSGGERVEDEFFWREETGGIEVVVDCGVTLGVWACDEDESCIGVDVGAVSWWLGVLKDVFVDELN